MCSTADEVLIADAGRSGGSRSTGPPPATRRTRRCCGRCMRRSRTPPRRTPSVRVVVLAGLGPSFSAGHDLKEAAVNAEYRETSRPSRGGCGRRLTCSSRRSRRCAPAGAHHRARPGTLPRRVADAGRRGRPRGRRRGRAFASRVTRDMGAADVELPSLAWAVGERRAKQLLWTSEALGARDAQALGLVNWVVARRPSSTRRSRRSRPRCWRSRARRSRCRRIAALHGGPAAGAPTRARTTSWPTSSRTRPPTRSASSPSACASWRRS